MSESASPVPTGRDWTSSAQLAAELLPILGVEERYWRQEGNKARAERFALVARVVAEEAERSGEQPSSLLQALGRLYRSSR